jgi:hypothetical protein
LAQFSAAPRRRVLWSMALRVVAFATSRIAAKSIGS